MHVRFPELPDVSARSIGFGVVTWLFAVVVVAAPLIGGTYTVVSAVGRRQPALFGAQMLLTMTVIAWYWTPVYRDHALGSVVPPLVVLLQFGLRRRFGGAS